MSINHRQGTRRPSALLPKWKHFWSNPKISHSNVVSYLTGNLSLIDHLPHDNVLVVFFHFTYQEKTKISVLASSSQWNLLMQLT